MTEWTVNNKLNDWYRKQYHIKLPKQYETKSLLYFSTVSPSTLFAASEPGMWLDPSDLSTMFVDRYGVTPVTTPGQEVGLRLDKSKGLVLGSELRQTGTIGLIGTATAATYNTATGEASVSRGADASNQSFVLVSGLSSATTYKVSVTNTAATSLLVRASNSTGTVLATILTGASRDIYLNGSTQYAFTASGNSLTVTFTISSFKEIAGNHAQANADLSRGIYGIEPRGGRRNLLTFTEQLDNAVWVKTAATITANAVVAPDGTTTGDSLVVSTLVSAQGVASELFATDGTSTYAASIYLLKTTDAGVPVAFYFRGAIGAGLTYASLAVNTTTGFSSFALSSATSGNYIVQDLGAWWRIGITAGGIPAGTIRSVVRLVDQPVSTTISLWGAQVERGTSSTAYQRVVDQYNVTEAGVPTLHYVQYDGSDDGYVTPTITPGTDKVQVFAGVRKLSDAAIGMVVESSLNAASGNAFQLRAPGSAANTYLFGSAGSLSSTATATGFSAPITNVLTGLGDISGDTVTLRVNGTQAAQNTADQGTGNYLAYPLYIGRRGGATPLSFNGRDYGIIVRFGANLDAATIADMEGWMNDKTGAY